MNKLRSNKLLSLVITFSLLSNTVYASVEKNLAKSWSLYYGLDVFCSSEKEQAIS